MILLLNDLARRQRLSQRRDSLRRHFGAAEPERVQILVPGEFVEGRLAVSVRDFARFGLLYLRDGKWKDKQVVESKWIKLAMSNPIPADLPLTEGKDAAMLPGARSGGGSKNITPVGPGYYSFNWWLNRTDKLGRRLYVDAPPGVFLAAGHGGERMLWIFPSLDLIVSWNDAKPDDHDGSPGNPETKCNRAARLIKEAAIERGENR